MTDEDVPPRTSAADRVGMLVGFVNVLLDLGMLTVSQPALRKVFASLDARPGGLTGFFLQPLVPVALLLIGAALAAPVTLGWDRSLRRAALIASIVVLVVQATAFFLWIFLPLSSLSRIVHR